MGYTHFDSVAAETSFAVGAKNSEVAVDIRDYVLEGEITDISTGASHWVVAPFAGTIEKIYSVISGTISGDDAGLSFELGGTAVTGGGITVAYDGSAAGDVDSATPTAANAVTAGQAIEMITDGASTGTVKAKITFVIRRT